VSENGLATERDEPLAAEPTDGVRPTDGEPTDLPASDGEPADGELADGELSDGELSDGEPADESAGSERVDTDPPDDDLVDDHMLDSALEALLLVVDEPVDEAALAAALRQPTDRVETALARLTAGYRDQERGIDLRKVGLGWRFYTRDRYAPYVERMLKDGQRARLTRAALETLAVVAYRQPVTRARVSAVRGVNCDGVMRTLLTRGLVEEFGIDPQTQGILYRTSEMFLERLGLSSLAELPPLAPLLPEVDSIDDV
jgi:segregation and condensation protein B